MVSSYVKDLFNMVYDGMCVLFVPAVYRSTVLILFISVSMFFGSLASVCTGIRFFKTSAIAPNQVQAVNGHDEEMQKMHEA